MIDPYTLVYAAAYTGLRAGELAGLRRADLDLLHSKLTVSRSLKDVNGHLSYGPTKTHQTRTVLLPGFLAKMLAEHLSSSNGSATGPDAPLFRMKGEGRMGLVSQRYFKRAVKGYTARGEHFPGALPKHLHGLRFHDLRHTAASLAVSAGAHPKHIQEMLCHSSITVTPDRYSHIFPSAHEARPTAGRPPRRVAAERTGLERRGDEPAGLQT